MSYCTRAQVQADFKDLTFTSTTNVTDTDVDRFIVEADALIDSYVGQVYVVPVTAVASQPLLCLFSRTLVADRIKKIMEVNQVTNTKANQHVLGAYGAKDVLKQLEALRDEDLNLQDAELLNSAGGFFSNNYQNDVTPEITKSTKEW